MKKSIFFSLFVLLCSVLSLSAQEGLIDGVVLDATSTEPVIGAYVINSVNGETSPTGLDGDFKIKGAPGQKLVVSSLGYRDLEVVIPATKDTLKILLPSIQERLDDAVVVGYASQKRVNITGAVATISSDELQNRPSSSMAHMLQGVDPSLNINMSSGNPVDGVSVNIRGVASINGGSPLVLVDGIPGMNLKYLNPEDVESISVLKDASASAIYGAKASAGVILVTTKSGKTGDAKVTYNGSCGLTEPTTEHDYITNGYEYATLIDATYRSRYNYSPFYYTDKEWAALEARRYDTIEHTSRPWVIVGDDGSYHYVGNFDWYHNVYNTLRFHHKHELSVSGGSERVKYYFSGGFFQQEGILSGPIIPKQTREDYYTINLRGKIEADLFKWAKWKTNVAYNGYNQRYPGHSDESLTIASLEESAMPMFVPVNPDGSYVMYNADLRGSALGRGRTTQLVNPYDVNRIEGHTITMSNTLEITPFKDLQISVAHNLNRYERWYKDRSTADIYSQSIGEYLLSTHYAEDQYRERVYQTLTQSIDAYATYSHTWAKAHNFKVVAGLNYEWYKLHDDNVLQHNVGSEDMSTFTSVKDDTFWTVTQSLSAYRTLGFFARVNYDYKQKYLFEASLRADGTSRFAKDSRWGVFPSASLGWRFTEEEFMQGAKPWLTYGKLRFSYGSLGNQQVSNYLYLDRIGTGTLSYLFDGDIPNYSYVSDPLASNLTWETVTTYNLGLDMNFFDSRLNFSGDFYIRDTKGMLTSTVTLPSVYGAGTPTGNAADLRTTGWELSLSWHDSFRLAGSQFDYTIGGTLGDYTRIITRFNNPTKLFSNYYEGKELGEIWGYHVPRLFSTDEEAAAYQASVNNSSNVYQRVYNMINDGYLRAGDVMFADLDGSGSIGTGAGTVSDPGDMRIIGNSSPHYSYSFRIEISWYGFDLSAFFQGVGKRDWYPTANADNAFGSNQFWQIYGLPMPSFISKDFMQNCWSESNPTAYFPRVRPIQSYNGGPLAQPNDRYLQSIAYLRFKNLTFGYTFHIKQKYCDRVRVYFAGENLCYWSPLQKINKNIDPELAASTGTYKSGTGSGYQMPRTYSIGVNFSF